MNALRQLLTGLVVTVCYLGATGPALAQVDKHDYNGDGHADLLWHNRQTGQIQAWFLDGIERIGHVFLQEGSPRYEFRVLSPWRLAATGRVDPDNNTDLIWHDPQTGIVQVWFMSGTKRRGYNIAKELSTGETLRVFSPWHLVDTGYFDNDNQLDLLWRNQSTGELQVWFMIGTNRKGFNAVKEQATLETLFPSSDWEVIGTADISQDGRPDIVWHNGSTGETQVWLMDGTNRVGYRVLTEQNTQQMLRPTAPWHLVGLARVNRDPWTDLIWHNEVTGETQVWFRLGTERVSYNLVRERSTQRVLQATDPWQSVGK